MSVTAARTTQKHKARVAAASGFFGSTMEYYDFLIYGTGAALFFGQVFFPDSSLSTLLALSSFAVAYVARPFGAAVCGHLGDRYSRKTVLLGILIMMGTATFLVGCIPSYASIGPTAPVILVLLRVIQGLSAGGEQSGSALLALEHAPDRERGFYTSWTQSGSQFGNFLAFLVFLPLTAILPENAMLSWGWRIPFWASALVILLTVLLRIKLAESEVHKDLEREGLVAKIPLIEVFRYHWRAVLQIVVASLCIAPAGLVYIFGLSYATHEVGLSKSAMLLLISGSSFVMIATQPLSAMLSDRIGRKPVFVTGLAGCAALIPVWLGAVNAANLPVIYLAGFPLLAVFTAMTSGVLLATFLEMFPAQLRFTGMAVSFTVGIVVTGFLPAIAQSFVLEDPDNWAPISWMIVGFMIAAAAAVLTMPETYRVPTAELGMSRTCGTVREPGAAVMPTASAKRAEQRPPGQPTQSHVD